MRGHVDRHPLEPRLEIRPVIEVEAADEILVRLPIAGVLRDDETGHRLEQLALTRERAKAQIGGTDVTLGRGRRDADEVVGSSRYADGLERTRPRAVSVIAGGILLCSRNADGGRTGHEKRYAKDRR
jgi:hypothetical protein